MNEIFFLLLIFLIIITGIKLSYYINKIDQQTMYGSLIIGGIVLASVTSLPEFIILLSNAFTNNLKIPLNSILNSSILNFTILAFYDIVFIKNKFINKISSKFVYILFILIYLYITISVSFRNNKPLFFNIGKTTIIIFIGYLLFLFITTKITFKQQSVENSKKEKYLNIKFILSMIFMIIFILLSTITVDRDNILIMIIPELVIMLTLIKLENYNMAFSVLVGSNMFNILILGIADLFIKENIIYNFYDINSIMLTKLCVYTTIITFIYTIRGKITNTLLYIIPSLTLLIIYIYFLLII